MVRASVSGHLDYSKWNPEDPICAIRERLVLEELAHEAYTDIWAILCQRVDTRSENWRQYAKYRVPWYDWEESGINDPTGGTAKRADIKREQYKWPEFKAKVDEMMKEGATREQAEQIAEFHMLQKLGQL